MEYVEKLVKEENLLELTTYLSDVEMSDDEVAGLALLCDKEIELRYKPANTKTSKVTDHLLELLAEKLQKKAREYYFKSDDVEGIRHRYYKEIYDMIYETIVSTYILGLNYVKKSTDFNPVIYPKSLFKIEEQTKELSYYFWKTFNRSKTVKLAIVEDDAYQHDLDEISSMDAFINGIVSNLLISTLATATFDGAQQYSAKNRFSPTKPTVQVRFTTRRDIKVCPICELLDGNTYDVDPFTNIILNAPLIPDETHPNCRCRYYIVINGQVMSG
jgi:hypothetical protein